MSNAAPNYTTPSRQLTLAAVQQMLEAVVADAQSLGLAVVVSVVDASGVLLGALRMPGAFLHSIDIAHDKAYTAAGFGFRTSQWPEMFREDQDIRTAFPVRPRLVVIGGGLPIKVDGIGIGGIGVSGATAEQDEAFARTGLRAIGLDA
jgi:uncharacterized protein GlcG (DUF336 family)